MNPRQLPWLLLNMREAVLVLLGEDASVQSVPKWMNDSLPVKKENLFIPPMRVNTLNTAMFRGR